MNPDPVARREVEITNPYGFHLRPADRFVSLAHQFQAEIRIHYNEKEVNGKSILDLATLAAVCGARLVLVARGPDAEAAVTALAELVREQFHVEDEAWSKDQAP